MSGGGDRLEQMREQDAEMKAKMKSILGSVAMPKVAEGADLSGFLERPDQARFTPVQSGDAPRARAEWLVDPKNSGGFLRYWVEYPGGKRDLEGLQFYEEKPIPEDIDRLLNSLLRDAGFSPGQRMEEQIREEPSPLTLLSEPIHIPPDPIQEALEHLAEGWSRLERFERATDPESSRVAETLAFCIRGLNNVMARFAEEGG